MINLKRFLLLFILSTTIALAANTDNYSIFVGGPYFAGGNLGIEASYKVNNKLETTLGVGYLGLFGGTLSINSGFIYYMGDPEKRGYIYSSYNLGFYGDENNNSIILSVGTRKYDHFDFRVGSEYNFILAKTKKDFYRDYTILNDLLPLTLLFSIAYQL